LTGKLTPDFLCGFGDGTVGIDHNEQHGRIAALTLGRGLKNYHKYAGKVGLNGLRTHWI